MIIIIFCFYGPISLMSVNNWCPAVLYLLKHLALKSQEMAACFQCDSECKQASTYLIIMLREHDNNHLMSVHGVEFDVYLFHKLKAAF